MRCSVILASFPCSSPLDVPDGENSSPIDGTIRVAMSFRVAVGLIFVISVASDPTMDSARAGALESDGRR
jgi:hypothetical protein